MSINSEIPRGVENEIRKLRDNDAFVSQIWSILAGYRDIRTLETEAKDLQDERDCVDKVLRYLDKYLEAVNEASRYGPYGWSKRDDEMRGYWLGHKEKLESRENKTKQNSILWLVETLLGIFNTWVISDGKLSGFIVKVLPAILPEKDIPSRSLIQAAKKELSS